MENSNLKVPSRLSWGLNICGQDEIRAFENFYGKSYQQAIELFIGDSLSYQDDLNWMPSKPLNFYLLAFIDYLLGDDSKGDADGASGLLSLLNSEQFVKELEENTISKVKLSLSFIEKNQDWFEASTDIYGSFEEKVMNIKKMIDAQ